MTPGLLRILTILSRIQLKNLSNLIKSEFQPRQTRQMNPSLEEGEEDGGAEVGRDCSGHRQVGARDEPLHEGGHLFVLDGRGERCDLPVSVRLSKTFKSLS